MNKPVANFAWKIFKFHHQRTGIDLRVTTFLDLRESSFSYKKSSILGAPQLSAFATPNVCWLSFHLRLGNSLLTGLRDNLQANPTFDGKDHGFRFRFSQQQSIHVRYHCWYLLVKASYFSMDFPSYHEISIHWSQATCAGHAESQVHPFGPVEWSNGDGLQLGKSSFLVEVNYGLQ